MNQDLVPGKGPLAGELLDDDEIAEYELTVVTDGTFENTRVVDQYGRVVKGVTAVEYATDWAPLSDKPQTKDAFVVLKFASMQIVKIPWQAMARADMGPEPPEEKGPVEAPAPTQARLTQAAYEAAATPGPGVQSASGAHETDEEAP